MNDHDSWVTDSFWGDDEAEEDFDFATYETELEPCGRGWGKVTTSKLNLEKALKDLARQQDTVQKLLQQAQRFPEEFEVGTVLKFKHVFTGKSYPPVRKAYDYVALRADNGFWYLTCCGSKTMTWDQLVEFIGDEEVNILVENATV